MTPPDEIAGEADGGSGTTSAADDSMSVTTRGDEPGTTTDASSTTGWLDPHLCLPFEPVDVPDLDGFGRWHDIDGDGIATFIAHDAVVVRPTIPTTYSVRIQHADGRVIEVPGRHTLFRDIDGDGNIDVLISPTSGPAAWLRGLGAEDWFEDVPRAVSLDDDAAPELWNAFLHHVNNDAFADLVQHPEDGPVGVRLGRGDGPFGPRQDLLRTGESVFVVASAQGRVLVWEEDPRHGFTGRYTQLRFGETLANPGRVSTEVITVYADARGDFDSDGDIDVLGSVGGMLTLLQVADDGWTVRALRPAADFAIGAFDTLPGEDLLVADGEDALLIRNFAAAPTADPEPVLYVPAKEAPDSRLFLSGSSSPIVGDGIDSVSWVAGPGGVWIHARVSPCE